jgi:hypothetical protein
MKLDRAAASCTAMADGAAHAATPTAAPCADALFGSGVCPQVADSVELSSKLQMNAKAGEGALGFGARYAQRQLPHEAASSNAQTTPGPGAYEVIATRHGAEASPSGHTSSFIAAGHSAKPDSVAPTGDPGQYDPNRNREMAFRASQTFRLPAQSGGGNFGASTARELRIPPDMGRGGKEEDVPGPGKYSSALSHRLFTRYMDMSYPIPTTSFHLILSHPIAFPSHPHPTGT